MAKKSNPPNRGGSGPKVTKQTSNKGPIIGKMSSVTGSTKPWDLNKGKAKSLNFGKDVKKS
jgi:hypothetical protein